MAAKLKVFTWSDGFHAYTVAASSRAKALAAWGVARDLFKDGDAREITQGPDHAAALARPKEVIRRGLSVDVGKSARVAKPRSPSKADRDRVARLETERDALELERTRELERVAEDRRALDAREAQIERDHETRSAALADRLRTARAKLKG